MLSIETDAKEHKCRVLVSVWCHDADQEPFGLDGTCLERARHIPPSAVRRRTTRTQWRWQDGTSKHGDGVGSEENDDGSREAGTDGERREGRMMPRQCQPGPWRGIGSTTGGASTNDPSVTGAFQMPSPANRSRSTN